jgi:hypothetical protein
MYNRSALVGTYQSGDPFLGSVVKGIGKFAAGAVGGLISGGSPIAAISGGIRGIRGGAPAMPGGGIPVPSGLGRRTFSRPKGGPPGIGRIGEVIPEMIGQKPKRRRMNYSNQKALRRALRRATGYARQQKAVRKAASEFAREFGPKRKSPRRDLGSGHRHIR